MRLFVAVNFSADVRRALARLVTRLSASGLPVRWTPEPNLHLTLRWLGERGEGERAAVEEALRSVAAGAEPFEAAFGSVGAFPSPRRPRVIWIAVDGGGRLRLLRDELERRLAAVGFGREKRSFRPHVTLGRARREAAPGDFRPFVAVSGGLGIETAFTVDTVDLMRSHLSASGALYEGLSRAPLGKETLPAGDSEA